MVLPVGKGSKKRRRRKIRIKQSTKLVAKKDATKVSRPDTSNRKRMAPTIVPSNTATFKVKIKRKDD